MFREELPSVLSEGDEVIGLCTVLLLPQLLAYTQERPAEQIQYEVSNSEHH